MLLQAGYLCQRLIQLLVAYTESGNWVHRFPVLVCRLTNEVITPIGMKDKWNATYPSGDSVFIPNFENPELALYMSDAQFGTVLFQVCLLCVFKPILRLYLGNVDFQNDSPGLYVLKGNPALEGTALAPDAFGDLLLPNNHSPRSVDILPIFYTGVPNLPPYQLGYR